jgi:hypothetical protein
MMSKQEKIESIKCLSTFVEGHFCLGFVTIDLLGVPSFRSYAKTEMRSGFALQSFFRTSKKDFRCNPSRKYLYFSKPNELQDSFAILFLF